jgi:hypothetical protein
VFKNKRTTKVALSRDAQKVVSLSIGDKYRIDGPVYEVGDKNFINEPRITSLARPQTQKRVLLGAGIATFVILSTAGFLTAKQFIGSGDQPEARSSSHESGTDIPMSQSSTPPKSKATPTNEAPKDAATSESAGNDDQGVLSAPRTIRNYSPFTPAPNQDSNSSTPTNENTLGTPPADSTIDPAEPVKPTAPVQPEYPGETLGAQTPPPSPTPPPLPPAGVVSTPDPENSTAQ